MPMRIRARAGLYAWGTGRPPALRQTGARMAQPGGTDSPTDTEAEEDEAVIDSGVGRLRTDWAFLLKKATPWLDRVGSLVASGLILVAAARWWYLARDLTDPCGDLSAQVCNEVPEVLQGLQFLLAIAGTAIAVVLATFTMFQAVSGRRVPRFRTVVAVLATLGMAWVVVFVTGIMFF